MQENALKQELIEFEIGNGLFLPQDLKQFYLEKANSIGEYDENMYCFYPFNLFKSVERSLSHWSGVPDYSNVSNVLENSKHCFVFADHMFHMFVYAVRLYPTDRRTNEVYVLCGDQYKVVASCFADFMELYKAQSQLLHFGD